MRLTITLSWLGIVLASACKPTPASSAPAPVQGVGAPDAGRPDGVLGTVNGKPFRGVYAKADHRWRHDEKNVEVFTARTPCGVLPAKGSDPVVNLVMHWQEGETLTNPHKAGFQQETEESLSTWPVDSVRATLLSTGDAGVPARVRLQMSGRVGSVEGELPVEVCPPGAPPTLCIQDDDCADGFVCRVVSPPKTRSRSKRTGNMMGDLGAGHCILAPR